MHRLEIRVLCCCRLQIVVAHRSNPLPSLPYPHPLLFCLVLVLMPLSPTRPCETQPRPFEASTDVFAAFSLFAFAFTCHTNLFPIYLELHDPTKARMMVATHASMTVCFVL